MTNTDALRKLSRTLDNEALDVGTILRVQSTAYSIRARARSLNLQTEAQNIIKRGAVLISSRYGLDRRHTLR